MNDQSTGHEHNSRINHYWNTGNNNTCIWKKRLKMSIGGNVGIIRSGVFRKNSRDTKMSTLEQKTLLYKQTITARYDNLIK